MTASHKHTPELWGGIECSINRVGDCYFDQMEFSNHYQRGEEDIARIAKLGIKALRYPILWEYHQPYANSKIDWSWTADQLNHINQNNITPIAGLLHHGSGPAFTNLYDKHFSEKFVSYATQVAKQFPWLTQYTPINEPLTTARFSGLYGLWYPHFKDDHSFAEMFLNQLKAIVLSMRAIREINSDAKLIQTEDLGKTYSTPLLKYQADFENERRWLTYDFLCGRVDRSHALWNYFIDLGIKEKALFFFQENPCPPDVLGINHYLTSERFIDENIEIYPSHTHGGNHKHQYADVEAIRVKHHHTHGLLNLLLETWQRFDIPMALTEVHMHCTREEQIRWLKEKMDIATVCLQHDIPVKAVTAWSLLGAYGWNKLLTGLPFTYEPGIFDLTSGEPRATEMANVLAKFSANEKYTHPILDQPAWWNRNDRYIVSEECDTENFNTASRSLFILCSEGNNLLAECINCICKQRGILSYVVHLSPEYDAKEIEKLINSYNPWAILSTLDLYNFTSIYDIHTNSISISSNEREIKFVSILPYYAENNESTLNHMPLKNLFVKINLAGNSEFNAMEKTYKIDCNEASIIMSSFPYIAEFIHATLNLLIDNEHGVWEATKSSIVTLREVIEENAFG